MSIKYYYTSVSSSQEIKKHQQKIEMILDGKKIEYEKIDISADEDARKKMRDCMGDPQGLPPQLFNGDDYCGDFTKFDEAVENGELEQFLKLK